MANVLIIGASRGVGLESVKAALAAGHHVRAFSRSAGRMPLDAPNLEKINGDALKKADVEAALNGMDAVIQVLGIRIAEMFGKVTLFSEATKVLLPIMERRGVKRLVALTGYGAGDSKRALNFVEAVPFQLVFGNAYADKSIQEKLIEASQLDWTIVRPGVLVSGPSWGRIKVLETPDRWRNGVISRTDVADFLVRQLSDRQYLRQAPVITAV